MRKILVLAVGVVAAGAEWTVLVSGVQERFRGVSTVNEQVAWASGAKGTVVRTADGGLTWQRLTVPGAEKLDFRDIDAVDERTAYVLSIGPGAASRIYKTIDAGATWALQFQNADPKGFYDAMTFWDAAHGIAVGDAVDGKFSVLMTADGGKRWEPVTGLPPALAEEGAFAASGTNIAVVGKQIWIGFNSGRVLRSPDGGKTWELAVTGLATSPSAGIFSIAFRDGRNGVVVGGDYRQEGKAGRNAAVTSDGGRTWTVVEGLGGFRSVVAWVGKELVAVGPSGTDWSQDGGRTWKPVAGPGFHTFSAARGKRVGFGAGEKGLLGRLRW